MGLEVAGDVTITQGSEFLDFIEIKKEDETSSLMDDSNLSSYGVDAAILDVSLGDGID